MATADEERLADVLLNDPLVLRLHITALQEVTHVVQRLHYDDAVAAVRVLARLADPQLRRPVVAV